MRIKHWQGYGNLIANKVDSDVYYNRYGECKKRLVIEVIGNHEYGLVCENHFEVFNWLVRRFDKSIEDFTYIDSIFVEEDYGTDRYGNLANKAIYTIDISCPNPTYDC